MPSKTKPSSGAEVSAHEAQRDLAAELLETPEALLALIGG